MHMSSQGGGVHVHAPCAPMVDPPTNIMHLHYDSIVQLTVFASKSVITQVANLKPTPDLVHVAVQYLC